MANVAAIDLDDAQVVISDRHGADDAIERLRERLANDRRVTFEAATDGLGWIEHYNLLLSRSRAPFFLWMPHDDEFPSGYVSRLVRRLEAEPDAVLAYGVIEPVDLVGRQVDFAYRKESWDDGAPWSQRSAGKRLLTWEWAVPFRGVFRRDRVVAAGLLVPPCHDADVAWVFGIELLGRFSFDRNVVNRKSIHDGGASTNIERRLGATWEASREMRLMVGRLVRSAADVRYLERRIAIWATWATTVEMLRALARRGRLPSALRRAVRVRLLPVRAPRRRA